MHNNYTLDQSTLSDKIESLCRRITLLSLSCAALMKLGIRPIDDADWAYLYKALISINDMSGKQKFNIKLFNAIEEAERLVYILEFSVDERLNVTNIGSIH